MSRDGIFGDGDLGLTAPPKGIRAAGSGPSSILEEIHQTRPFRSKSQEATVGLFRTSDMLRRRYSRVVDGRDVTLQQYNVLRILRGAGSAGLPTLAIAERMIEQTPGITRLLDRLEAKSWVTRQRTPEDRRQVRCWITPEGLGLLDELDGPMNDAHDAGLGDLPTADVEILIGLLDRIRHGLRQQEAARYAATRPTAD